MSKKIDKKIAEIREFLRSSGWQEDRYLNFIKIGKDKNEKVRKYRFKFQATSLRYEVQNTFITQAYGSEKDIINHEWMRILSGYYKDITIDYENKHLVGLAR